MMSVIKIRAVKLIEFVHLKFFGHKMSDQMRAFLSNLSWSFISGSIVMLTMVIILTLAGRLMGPEEYGKYNLLLVISQFIVIFAFCGLDISAVKAIAKAKNPKETSSIIYSSFMFVLFMLLFILLLVLIFGNYFSHIFNVSQIFVWLILLYAIFVSIKAVFEIFVKGLEEFKLQTKAKIIEMVSIVMLFITFFILFSFHNYIAYTLVTVIGAINISLFYVIYLKKYFNNISLKRIIFLLSEGKFFMFSVILATIFFSLDRFLLAKYVDIRTLGIYSAYYIASFGLAAQIAQLFTNVFLPASARSKDKTFVKKLDKIFLVGFIPIFLGSIALIILALLIFGKDYPIRLDYLSLFSIVSTLYFFQSLYNTVILDLPKNEYKKYFYLSNSVNIIVVSYYLILIYLGIVSVNLVLLGLVSDVALLILIQRILINKMFERLNKNLVRDNIICKTNE